MGIYRRDGRSKKACGMFLLSLATLSSVAARPLKGHEYKPSSVGLKKFSALERSASFLAETSRSWRGPMGGLTLGLSASPWGTGHGLLQSLPGMHASFEAFTWSPMGFGKGLGGVQGLVISQFNASTRRASLMAQLNLGKRLALVWHTFPVPMSGVLSAAGQFRIVLWSDDSKGQLRKFLPAALGMMNQKSTDQQGKGGSGEGPKACEARSYWTDKDVKHLKGQTRQESRKPSGEGVKQSLPSSLEVKGPGRNTGAIPGAEVRGSTGQGRNMVSGAATPSSSSSHAAQSSLVGSTVAETADRQCGTEPEDLAIFKQTGNFSKEDWEGIFDALKDGSSPSRQAQDLLDSLSTQWQSAKKLVENCQGGLGVPTKQRERCKAFMNDRNKKFLSDSEDREKSLSSSLAKLKLAIRQRVQDDFVTPSLNVIEVRKGLLDIVENGVDRLEKAIAVQPGSQQNSIDWSSVWTCWNSAAQEIEDAQKRLHERSDINKLPRNFEEMNGVVRRLCWAEFHNCFKQEGGVWKFVKQEQQPIPFTTGFWEILRSAFLDGEKTYQTVVDGMSDIDKRHNTISARFLKIVEKLESTDLDFVFNSENFLSEKQLEDHESKINLLNRALNEGATHELSTSKARFINEA